MAADTFSSILGVLVMGTGNDNNSWGDNVNNAILPVLEKAIAGTVTHAVTGGTLDLSGTPPPAGATQAAEMIQIFTGALTADQVVKVPNLSKLWLVDNQTTGAFDLAFQTPTGTISASIPQNGGAFVYCDGANNIYVGLSTTLRDIQWLGADGVIGAPGISFASEPTMGLRRVSTGVMALTIMGVDVLTISSSAVTLAAGVSLSAVPSGVEVNSAAINEPAGWYFEYGQTKTRAGDPLLMAAITASFTATTNGTAVLTGVSKDLRGLGVEGSVLEGTGIFTGSTIVSVDSATQITMNHVATNSATGGTVTAFPFGNGDGSTTFTLPDARDTVAVARGNMGGTAKGLVTVAGSSFDTSKLLTVAGNQNFTLTTPNLPPYTPAGGISGTGTTNESAPRTNPTFAFNGNDGTTIIGWRPGAPNPPNFGTLTINGSQYSFSGTAQGGTSTPVALMQPGRVRNVLIKR